MTRIDALESPVITGFVRGLSVRDVEALLDSTLLGETATAWTCRRPCEWVSCGQPRCQSCPMAIRERDGPSRQKSGLLRQIGSVKGIPEAAIEVPLPSPTVTMAAAVGMGTADLLDAVVEAGYTGPAWGELQRRLVVRAFPDLERAITTGTIYRRCAHAGVRIQRRADLQIHPYPEDIAAEAVEDCLRRFRNTVLPGGQWDPAQGVSLEDFFCVCCLPDLANRWRWHLRHLPEASLPLEAVREDQILMLPVEPVGDPADTFEHREVVAQTLAPMKPADQSAFVLLAAGWTPEEIARTLGITRNTFDARISRARKTARARRTW